MIEKFYPDFCFRSVFDIKREFYEENKIKAVIFDIDNTLVTHNTAVPPAEVREYLESLKSWGIRAAIVSNNKKSRVDAFCGELGLPYAARAYKPRRKYLEMISDRLDVPAENICLVGDQIFTDVFGANRMGFVSVMVTALGENETGFVAFKRIFEKIVMKRYPGGRVKDEAHR